jgi:hypothetical protein
MLAPQEPKMQLQESNRNVLSSYIARSNSFDGITEVLSPSEDIDVIDGKEGEPDDIEEVADITESDDVIDGGAVIMRNVITITILSVWTLSTFVGLVEFLLTSSAVLLITLHTFMSMPLYKVLSHHLKNR